MDFLYLQKQGIVLDRQYSSRGATKSGFPRCSILGPLLCLIYISDLFDGLAYNPDLFADDVSLVPVVENMTKSANDVSNHL